MTELPAVVLLKRMHGIEEAAGRQRVTVNEARVLDLDILFYGKKILRRLTIIIPHPRLHERAFVLVPFCDLAPEFIHPALNKSIKQLLEEFRGAHDGVRGVERVTSGT